MKDKNEFESLNDIKWIEAMEDWLQKMAEAIKDIINCTIGSIVDISCKKCLNKISYDELFRFFYNKTQS